MALTFATTAAGLVGKAANPAWAETASKLVILFNGTYHPEYEGYAPPTVIKQADVILLGFPLMVEGPEYHMTKEVRKADLDIYGAVTGDEELSVIGDVCGCLHGADECCEPPPYIEARLARLG